jgi:hypothetical protein
MRIHTESVVLTAPYEKAFQYIVTPKNLTRWSTNFILSLEEVGGGRYAVSTPHGRTTLALRHNEEVGTVDFLFGDAATQMIVPTRLVRLGPERALYLFTLILPDLPDQEFSKAIRGLQEELELLRKQVE